MNDNNSQQQTTDSVSRDNESDQTQTGQTLSDKNKPLAKHLSPDPTRFGDWEKDGRCIDF
ncbi:MAG: DUF1674 domain-containing protein [Gammaproteobacteria bacterium]|nr:DUF1674 domain-containing protein [Gammaproteobacteria bacterium]